MSIKKSFINIIFLFLTVIVGCQNECLYEEQEKNEDCWKDFKITETEAREIADRLAIENERDPAIYDVTVEVIGCEYWFFYEAKENSGILVLGDPQHFTICVSGLNSETHLIKGQ